MIFLSETPYRHDMQDIYRRWIADEKQTVSEQLEQLQLDNEARKRIVANAAEAVRIEREYRGSGVNLDALLHEYSLSSEEGVLLMCLAEALLRIPDSSTADQLIADKLASGNWTEHLGHSDSLLVNASTWGIMLTGKLINLTALRERKVSSQISRLANQLTEPVLRTAITQAMHILGKQFVLGNSIEDALLRCSENKGHTYRYSFDMLGEAAVTKNDAERYFQTYQQAINAIGLQTDATADNPGISVKLSALYPRYRISRRTDVLAELIPRILALANQARDNNISITIDAEESDRLELSLEVLEAVCQKLTEWDGLGIAVQTYLKSAPAIIEWLVELAQKQQHRLMLRLVKGAYWDSEIKQAQLQGLSNYPTFTRKAHSDICYLRCAGMLLKHPECFYPQFATHNAHTLMAVLELAGKQRGFEFQRLHGMGEALYSQVAGDSTLEIPCRIYAPVGPHQELLSYLVRRLIENGANSSFINRLNNRRLPAENVVKDPVEIAISSDCSANPAIPLPVSLYPDRQNSAGINLSDPDTLQQLDEALSDYSSHQWHAALSESNTGSDTNALPVINPADNTDCVGYVQYATDKQIRLAVRTAQQAFPAWSATSPDSRANLLEAMASILESRCTELMALVIRESGKTISDAAAEVREAVDFCRYYALQCRQLFAQRPLDSPTGESNTLALHGRGIFLCISPWNFPLAIYCGQIAAALAAGNTVIAKPAEQSCLTAWRTTELFHRAGIPDEVLQCLPGDGETGAALVSEQNIAGIAFTGSENVAHGINATLANKAGPIIPLIAETGGINCMIVDSSALVQQVVEDVLSSAFQSAGQRCSALRVLYIQEDIADGMLSMLAGALEERVIGDPRLLETDIGPLIDKQALVNVKKHINRLAAKAKCICRSQLPDGLEQRGNFLAPCIFEIVSLTQLKQEIFGPVLHVIRYQQGKLQEVIEQINTSGYGLTLALHSRLDSTIEHVTKHANVGNIYVNRNQIGAVVGVQPFGGEGLSGTGPKAGGPHTLLRYATERTVSINSTAQGGDAELLSQNE